MTGSRQFLCMPPEIFCDGNLKEKAVTKLVAKMAVTFDPVNGERVVTGLWTNAVEMGRCAGYNMTGRIFLAESYRLRIS